VAGAEQLRLVGRGEELDQFVAGRGCARGRESCWVRSGDTEIKTEQIGYRGRLPTIASGWSSTTRVRQTALVNPV
jgi:hypothetical protein